MGSTHCRTLDRVHADHGTAVSTGISMRISSTGGPARTKLNRPVFAGLPNGSTNRFSKRSIVPTDDPIRVCGSIRTTRRFGATEFPTTNGRNSARNSPMMALMARPRPGSSSVRPRCHGTSRSVSMRPKRPPKIGDRVGNRPDTDRNQYLPFSPRIGALVAPKQRPDQRCRRSVSTDPVVPLLSGVSDSWLTRTGFNGQRYVCADHHSDMV